MTELKSYSLPELETLAEQIKTEIHKREQEEQEAVKRQAEEAERAAAAEAARLAAEAAAKAAADTAEKARAQAAAKARKQAAEKASTETSVEPDEVKPVRFMHPSNRALTWSGSGPTPDWVNAWLATGGTLYALEIAAEKLAPKPIPDSLRPH